MIIRQLKPQRKRLGLTQKQIAQRVSITRIHYSHIETNVAKTKKPTLRRILEELELPVTWIDEISIQDENIIAQEMVELLSRFSPENQERLLCCLREFAKLLKELERNG